jgi:Isoprenylcysteine carboxyl methyltransferase (ICMT) family
MAGYSTFNFTLQSLGRIAAIAVTLGFVGGVHLFSSLLILLHRWYSIVPILDELLSPARIAMLCQWCAYIVLLTGFHLTEFFITALYNPTTVTAESFLVNHSMGYTAAFIASTLEFWTRFCLLPSSHNSVILVGFCMIFFGQAVRSLAMATCGASFNHVIQTTKKDSHVLITHGM